MTVSEGECELWMVPDEVSAHPDCLPFLCEPVSALEPFS